MIKDLRDWLREVGEIGELVRVRGAHWDVEMGPLTHLVHEAKGGDAPAFLFDDVPGYAAGYRTLYGQLSTIKRLALTLGLPLEYKSKADFVRAYQEKMSHLQLVPPVWVDTGPVKENVHIGDDINVLEFPVPRHHELDTARYIGTACVVITQDPDEGWFNLGTYRSQVYDGKTVGCQITEGKHGRIHRDKYFERGQPMKVAIVCGQDPLLYLLGSSPMPEGISEYEYAGAIKGEPIEVVAGEYTGFPVPATAEIVIEGDILPEATLPEGPFGEWTGYYCSAATPRPYVQVKCVMHRNDPILTCAPQHKPVDETVLLKGVAGAAGVWQALRAAGIPEIRGVWCHEGGLGVRFMVVSIHQRYPGYARQVLHVASSCQAGAYNGKWVVVVDDDIDPADMSLVLWAMSTRFDPVTDIDIIQKAWSSGRDPMVLPGNYNNRILIDACIPYDRKLRGTFPPVVDVSPELREKLGEKYRGLLS
ncbi:MAG: UbiD family decarboxylase [Chloroflexi bacterium]|nr:UbiD family decarboxylase [Chloroflexota bacterium]